MFRKVVRRAETQLDSEHSVQITHPLLYSTPDAFFRIGATAIDKYDGMTYLLGPLIPPWSAAAHPWRTVSRMERSVRVANELHVT